MELFEAFVEQHRDGDRDAQQEFLDRHAALLDLLEPMFRTRRAVAMNPDSRELSGEFSHYHILRPLGEGGMGQVYLARDVKLDREVAVKVLPPDFAADVERRVRFLRESQLAAKLSHPSIATVYEADEVDGRLYYAMELVRGETLQARIKPGGLSTAELLQLAVPLTEGLAEAHRHGVVHRDLKPGNVMVDERGQLKILDFGLSRGVSETDSPLSLTASGQLLGTPQYMSPEQVRGQTVDPRSDLFSVGAIFYELATGVRPFAGETSGEVMNAVLNHHPPPVQRANPRLDDRMTQVIGRLLEKDRELRIQTAADLRAALKGLHRPERTVPARRWLPIAVVAALLAVFLLWSRTTGDQRPSVAILPFAVPAGDAGAEAIARTFLYNLPQALVSTEVDIIPASYITSMAKREGTVLGAEDQVAEAELARLAGADLMVVGRILPLAESFQVICELIDCHDIVIRDAHTLSEVSLATVSDDVDELAIALQEPLGVGAVGLSVYSQVPEAWISFALGQQSMDRGAWRQAAAHFSDAIGADPDFALGYYHRAWAWVWLEEGTGQSVAEDDLDRALQRGGRLTPDDREKAVILRGAVQTFWQAPGMLERARRFAVSRPRDAEAQRLWMEFAIHHESESTAREALAACQSFRDARPEFLDAVGPHPGEPGARVPVCRNRPPTGRRPGGSPRLRARRVGRGPDHLGVVQRRRGDRDGRRPGAVECAGGAAA